MNLINKANNAIKKYNMIDKETPVVVALSGGADSMALFHYLINHTSAKVTALHVNHNLRAQHADKDQEFVQEICKQWNIELEVVCADVNKLSKELSMSIEEAGRQVRYDALTKAVAKKGKVATAHTQSDSVESVLLNMTRGTGLRGLSGIPAVRKHTSNGKTVDIIRPFIDCSRADIEDYCIKNNIPYVQDATNIDTVFARNRIRHNVIPELKKINTTAPQAIARLTYQVQDFVKYMDNKAYEVIEETKIDGKNTWNQNDLNALDDSLKSHTLWLLIDKFGQTCDSSHIEMLNNILESDGQVNLPGNLIARASQGVFQIIDTEKIQSESKNIQSSVEIGKICTFYDDKYAVKLYSFDEYRKIKKIHKNLFKNALCYDKIRGKLILRTRKPKDYIQLVQKRGTKTLKKLYNELNIPVWERQQVPVVCDNDGVVLLIGIGPDKRVCVDSNEKCNEILVFEQVL